MNPLKPIVDVIKTIPGSSVSNPFLAHGLTGATGETNSTSR